MAPAPTLEDLIQTAHDRAATAAPIDQLAAAAAVANEVDGLADGLLDHFVTAARKADCSWGQIGETLGVSRQGAHQRFALPRERLLRSAFEQRITGRARKALARARSEALELGHNYVGTEHLLLALLPDRESLAVEALAELGATADAVRAAVLAQVGPPSPAGLGSGHVPFTPRAARALDVAQGEALALGHNYLGTEHILVALATVEDGMAAAALAELGLDSEQLRREVVRLLSGYRP